MPTPSVADVTAAFVRYLDIREAAALKERLTDYLNLAMRVLEEEKIDRAALIAIIGQLAVLFPLHVLRRNFTADNHATLRGVAATYALDAPDEIVQAIETALAVLSAAGTPGILLNLPDLIDVVGFDPRFRSGEAAAKSFRSLLDEAGVSRDVEIVAFTDSYGEAKARVFRDFRDHATRYDLLFVDYTWLPELAAQGHIVPIDRDLEPQVRQRIAAELAEHLKDTEFDWAEAATYLSSADNDFVYSLPFILNFHVRIENPTCPLLASGGLDLKTDRFEALTLKALGSGSIQSDHRSCLVFELWAHMAYHGAVPIEFVGNEAAVLKRVDFLSAAARNALADYLIRLFAYWTVGVKGKRTTTALRSLFSVGHEEERRNLMTTGREFHWSPCFSTELYSAFAYPALVNRFSVVRTAFRNTDMNPKDNRLLCFGGYGLAISREAVDRSKAYETAWKLFKANAAKVVTQKLKLGPIDGDVKEFMRNHTRPRLPVWSSVEGAVSMAVEELFLAMIDDVKTLQDAETVEMARSEVSAWLDLPGPRRVLESLNAGIELSFAGIGVATRERFAQGPPTTVPR